MQVHDDMRGYSVIGNNLKMVKNNTIMITDVRESSIVENIPKKILNYHISDPL